MGDHERERMEAVLIGAPDVEIVVLEVRICAAQRASDVQALDALLSTNLLFTGPDGQLISKMDDIAAHRSGRLCFRALEPQALRVRRVNDGMAVAALRARLVIDVEEAWIDGVFCYTRVWAREEDGNWRVVAGHVSAASTAATTRSESPAA